MDARTIAGVEALTAGTRVPSSEQEGRGDGKASEPKPMNPDRPDEFGDGDRRS